MSLVSGIQYSKEILGKRNVIINGDMSVNQRGFTTAAAANLAFVYTSDRIWYYSDRSTGASTLTRSTDVPTYEQAGVVFAASLDVDITTVLSSPASNNEAVIAQRIEGYNYDRVRGGDATFSCWVKSNKTGIYSSTFRNSGGDRNYVTEITIDTADTWEKKIIAVPLTETGGTWNYTNGYGLQVSIGLMASPVFKTSTLNQWNTVSTDVYSTNAVNLFDSTDNYFRTTGWQFEKGNTETEFESRSYGEELALCQRYVFVDGDGSEAVFSILGTGSVAATTTSATISIIMPVPTRVPVTSITTSGSFLIHDGTGGKTVTTITLADSTRTIAGLSIVTSSTLTLLSAVRLIRGNDATAKIIYDAEL